VGDSRRALTGGAPGAEYADDYADSAHPEKQAT
jgi:hypothetical protein